MGINMNIIPRWRRRQEMVDEAKIIAGEKVVNLDYALRLQKGWRRVITYKSERRLRRFIDNAPSDAFSRDRYTFVEALRGCMIAVSDDKETVKFRRRCYRAGMRFASDVLTMVGVSKISGIDPFPFPHSGTAWPSSEIMAEQYSRICPRRLKPALRAMGEALKILTIPVRLESDVLAEMLDHDSGYGVLY